MECKVGLIGYPVQHSLSPTIHNAIYRKLGVPWTYELYSQPTEADVRQLVQQARKDMLFSAKTGHMEVGFNVTTPYKKLAYQLADQPNLSALIVGGANTLSFVDVCDEMGCRTVLASDTTDGEGACRALEHRGCPVEGANVLVLGTGAAAMSIVASLLMRGAAQVRVASRDPQRAAATLQGIFDRAGQAYRTGQLLTWGFSDDRRNVLWSDPVAADVAIGYDQARSVALGADIVVNATPLGMKAGDGSPLPADSFKPGQMVMDAVYAHGVTQIRHDAQECGAQTMDGLGMLVEQALLSMSVWLEARGHAFCASDPVVYETLAQAGIDVPHPAR